MSSMDTFLRSSSCLTFDGQLPSSGTSTNIRRTGTKVAEGGTLSSETSIRNMALLFEYQLDPIFMLNPQPPIFRIPQLRAA